jgi:WD40 repeat protein
MLVSTSDGVEWLAFDPDGHRLVLSGGGKFEESGKAYVQDAATGRTVLTLRGHASNVQEAAFSPDGHRLASGGIDGTVRVWDVRPPPGPFAHERRDLPIQKITREREFLSACYHYPIVRI